MNLAYTMVVLLRLRHNDSSAIPALQPNRWINYSKVPHGCWWLLKVGKSVRQKEKDFYFYISFFFSKQLTPVKCSFFFFLEKYELLKVFGIVVFHLSDQTQATIVVASFIT